MNTLTLSLPQVGLITPWKGERGYDKELDGITSVLSDVCKALSEEGCIQFLVEGFGQERWPVDVETDLAVVIEQVPAVIKVVRRGESATLGFYEQGVERVLAIEPSGPEVAIECQSMTSWQPEPRSICMPTHELLTLLGGFLDEFVQRARERCPDLVQHTWFHEWLQEAWSS